MPNLTNIRDRVPAHQLALHAKAEAILGGKSYDEDEYLAAWAQAEDELGPEEPVRASISFLTEKPEPGDAAAIHGESLWLHTAAEADLAGEGKPAGSYSEADYVATLGRAQARLEEVRAPNRERELVANAIRLGIRLGEEGWSE